MLVRVSTRTLLIGAVLGAVVPTGAAAAAGGGHAALEAVLFGVAGLVVAARMGGILAERAGLPAVLGELLVGIGLGNLLPSLLALPGVGDIRSHPAVSLLATLGVLVLLFEVGLETDLRAFAGVGPSAVLVAVVGVVVPFALGWGVAAWLTPASSGLAHVFVGATLTATSVGITVRVLKDLGALSTREGQTILGAAVLDDVLGLVVLAVVGGAVQGAGTGASGFSVEMAAAILVKAALFLAVTVVLGMWLSRPIARAVARAGRPGLFLTIGLALCFTLAHVAELIGLAGIIGAFAAGLLLDPYGEDVRGRPDEAPLRELLHPIAGLFVPLFFVLMGLQVDAGALANPSALALGAALTAAAIAGKLACALGVVGRGIRRVPVAFGMLPRGEVGLIFASVGSTLAVAGAPLLDPATFSSIIIMVLVTTLIAPVGLRWSLRPRRRAPEGKDST